MYNCVNMICAVNALGSQSYLQEGLYGQIKPQENYCSVAQLRMIHEMAKDSDLDTIFAIAE